MAEWLYEDGIGEARAALIADGHIIEARIERDDARPLVGTIAAARIVETIIPRLSARVALSSGGEAILEGLPPRLDEGRTLLIQIVREPIPEAGRPKLAKALLAPPNAEPVCGPKLRERIAATKYPVRELLPHQPDELEAAGWSEVLDEAERGEIAFEGGALRMSLTPAMTLFDVDGSTAPGPLAIAAAHAVCAAIFRHSIGGSIGIDFPTLPDRTSRRAVDDAIDKALPQPFERTAINGFGFLQIVRRRMRPSLPELLRSDPVGAALRGTLRKIERNPPLAGQSLDLAPALTKRLAEVPAWLDMLRRRTGRQFEG